MIEPDFTQFHSALAGELRNKQDQVRNLIGGRHWLTDGEHKESILRGILKDKLPSTVTVHRGFACLQVAQDNNVEGQSSGQIDIVLRDTSYGVLLEEGGTVFLSPHAVKGIIEVKTKLQNSTNPNNNQGIRHSIQRLSDNVNFIRANGGRNCLAGLFIYEENISNKFCDSLLKTLQIVCDNDNNRVINYVSYGAKWFVRFWATSERESNVPYSADTQAWHLYHLDNLAQAYFINNFVVSLSPPIPGPAESSYFPLPHGKKIYRKNYITLDNNDIKSFS